MELLSSERGTGYCASDSPTGWDGPVGLGGGRGNHRERCGRPGPPVRSHSSQISFGLSPQNAPERRTRTESGNPYETSVLLGFGREAWSVKVHVEGRREKLGINNGAIEWIAKEKHTLELKFVLRLNHTGQVVGIEAGSQYQASTGELAVAARQIWNGENRTMVIEGLALWKPTGVIKAATFTIGPVAANVEFGAPAERKLGPVTISYTFAKSRALRLSDIVMSWIRCWIDRLAIAAGALIVCCVGLTCGRSHQDRDELPPARSTQARSAGPEQLVPAFPEEPPWQSADEVGEEIARLRTALPEYETARSVRDLLQNLALFRPELAASFLAEAASGEERATLLEMVERCWARSAPEDLFRWAKETLGGSEQIRACQEAVTAIAKSGDPVTAASLMEDMPYSDGRLYSLSDIARSWASTDLSGAYDWANGLGDDRERTWALSSLSDSLARDRPDFVRALIETEDNSGVREAMARALAGEQSESDSALDFVRSLPSELQAAASDEIAQRLSRRDPELALKYLEGADDAQMEIAGLRWAWTEILQRDPARAAASFAEFDSQEGVKEEMAPWLATMWYNVDSEGASRWVSELPQGEMRDRAIESLVSSLQLDDQELARAWANDISDETRRQAALQFLSYDRIVPRIE